MFKTMISSIVAKNMKKKLTNWTIKEEDVAEVLKQIRIALLDADVNLFVVKEFIKNIRIKAVGTVIEPNQEADKVLLKIIKDELIEILGQNTKPLNINSNFNKIMLVGLQGSGKTTSISKLAYYLKTKKEKKVLLVALDIYRPAAVDQLATLAKEIDVEMFFKPNTKVEDIAKQATIYAEENGFDVVLYDTAGRLQTNQELMQELKNVRKITSAQEVILVVDAMAGQDIINVAQEFNDNLNLTGLIITKLDSQARAGAVLSIISLLKIPVKFTGTGERVGSLDIFYPDRMADQILGLGDIMTLAEKAADVVDEDKAKKSFARMLAGKFDLEDLMSQLEQLNKMGSMSSILKMFPGAAGKISEDKINTAEGKIRIWKILMSSMTKQERRNPILFKKHPNRKIRVVKGSGRRSDELNKMLAEWEKSKQKMDEMGKMIRKGKNPFSELMK